MPDDDPRKTWEGLRADADCPTLSVSDSERLARDADTRAYQREEAKWRTLFESNLVNLASIPQPRDELRWASCDDLEVHVLLRAKGGASAEAILEGGPHAREALLGAMCRLAARGLLRFP